MSDEGRTYRVRNMYGYIEHLTAQEISNLLERGENITLVDDPRQSKGSGELPRRVVAAAIALFGAYGDVSGAQGSMASGALPGRANDALSGLADTAETSQRAERDRRRDDVEGGTRDKGAHGRGAHGNR